MASRTPSNIHAPSASLPALVLLGLLVSGAAHAAGSNSASTAPQVPVEQASVGMHTMTSALPNARWDFPAVWTGSQAILIGGGSTANPSAESILRYDPASDTMTVMQSRLYALSGVHSAVWIQGYAYIFTLDPTGTPSIVRYDPVADSLRTMTARPPFYATGGSPGAVTAVTDGNVAYLFGGEPNGAPNDRILRYDPATDQVTVMGARLPQGNKEMGAAFVAGAVYLFGGVADGTAIVRYDPKTDEATVLAARLPTGTRDQSVVFDGQSILLFGGDATSFAGGARSTILRFNVALGTLSQLSEAMPTANAYAPAVWTGTSACLFGGRSGASAGSSAIRCTDGRPVVLTAAPAAPCATASANSGTTCSVGSFLGWPDAALPFLPRPSPAVGSGDQAAAPVAAVGGRSGGSSGGSVAAVGTTPGRATGGQTAQSTSVDASDGSAVAVAYAAGATVAVAGAVAYTGSYLRAGRRPSIPFLATLFSRILPEKSMDHPARRQIADAIGAQPGIHLQALVQELGLARATVEHHVRVLMQSGVVHERRLGRYRCYYRGLPQRFPSAPPPSTMRSHHARDVLRQITANPGSAVGDVAVAIGSPPRVVSYHIQRLAQAGLLRLEHQGRFTRAFPSAQVAVASSQAGQAVAAAVPAQAAAGAAVLEPIQA